jgi:hypothetical protein
MDTDYRSAVNLKVSSVSDGFLAVEKKMTYISHSVKFQVDR